MSLFQELKRRNVFRVGIAYVVGAWLLLQFTEVITELLSLPPTIGPVVVTVVAIGFPVVLFAAWAYELTPEGIKRESEVDRSASITPNTGRKLNGLIIGLLSLAVVVLLADKFLLRDMGVDAAPSEAERRTAEAAIEAAAEVGRSTKAGAGVPGDEPPAPTIDPRSIAVLPFTNRSPESEDEFFIDGIHDDLLTNLARIGELKVISRTSVLRFKDTDTPIPEIAATLGVATVMEGAVQRAGDMVRINVQLIDAKTDEHLWAQIYDRAMTTDNLFAIQSEIAGHIAEALQARLTPAEERQLETRPTDNLAAYSAYLRGVRGFERRELATMRQALAEFRRAVELDPEFAHAWAGIAQVATVMISWSGLSGEEGRAIAEPAAERAMELAPELGEANLALAVTLEGAAAEDQFRTAIDLLPNSASAHQWYGNQLQDDLERWDEAAALFQKAVELDPLAPIYRHQVARHYMFAGRFAEAEAELRELLEVDPAFFPAVGFMAQATAAQGRFDESVLWSRRALESDPNSPFPYFGEMGAYITLRDAPRMRAVMSRIDRLESPPFPSLPAMAEVGLAMIEERWDAALESLERVETIPFAFDPEEVRSYLHAYKRDYPAARASQERANPGFFALESQGQQLKDDVGDACFAGFLLLRTGSVELGQALLDRTLAFIDEELPRYAADPEQWGRRSHCLAIRGRYDEALAVITRSFDRGNFEGWREYRALEYFEPLYGDPRFESLMTRVEDEMARQRASLDRLEAEEATGP